MSTPNRPAPRRSSLAGTNPIAPPPAVDEGKENPPTSTANTGETRTSPQPAKKAAPAAKADAGGMARLGIYLTPDEFNDAKAAYLTDWGLGGQADTFARWIGQAIAAHASRTPAQRAKHAQPRGRADVRTGSTRSFAIPAATVARMRAAINEDQQAERWASDSAWCSEAISCAVDATRAANGGTLPTPPPRLPNRLIR